MNYLLQEHTHIHTPLASRSVFTIAVPATSEQPAS